MGVGDFAEQGTNWGGGGGGGGGSMGGANPWGGTAQRGGFFHNANTGAGIGGSVQPMGQEMGGYQSNGAYTQGPVPPSQPQDLGSQIIQQWQQQQQDPRRYQSTQAAPELSLEEQLAAWGDIGAADAASPRYQAHQMGIVNDQNMMAQLGLLGLGYQQNVGYAQQDNALNQQMLELRKKLLGIDDQNVGIDKNSILNRKQGLGKDSEYLNTQRGMYDSQLANQLAQIDTRHQLDRLDHENQYVAGGGWFAPGQKYRGDRIDAGAEQNREAARLGTAMSQLGVDRSLNNNNTQQIEYDFDMQKLDTRLAANGINLQMLGLNQQQLGLALQKRIDDLGLGQWMDATQLLTAATQGGSEQSDYALSVIMEWLQGGGQGPIPGPQQGGF